MRVGQWVSVAPRHLLEGALSRPGCPRPRPEQYACAGRRARVVGAARQADGTFRYRLEGLPGSWREEWLVAA